MNPCINRDIIPILCDMSADDEVFKAKREIDEVCDYLDTDHQTDWFRNNFRYYS